MKGLLQAGIFRLKRNGGFGKILALGNTSDKKSVDHKQQKNAGQFSDSLPES